MTGNTNKARAVFLAMLMVFSVFAGTVAFSGSAVADPGSNFEYRSNAVHYENDSDTPIIEVPFDEQVNASSLTAANFTLLDDGDNITDYTSANITQRPNGRVVIDINQSGVVPSTDLEIDLSDQIRDQTDGTLINNPGEKTVLFAGQTSEFTGVGGGTPSPPANSSAYQGSVVAINTSQVDVAVTVEGEDNNYFAQGSTGANSSVFTFQTDNRELGEYKIFIQGTDSTNNTTFINVRDLQLSVSMDELSYSTTETIDGETSAVAGNRNVKIDLLDSSGDVVNTSSVNSLNGQGDADFSFDANTADAGSQLETGTYTVEVRDNSSGVTVESSEITISEADDEEAEFVQSTISDERGDILEATVELTETSEATINFGSPSDGVEANVTVEDDDGDDQVTVFINTYAFNQTATNANNVFNIDSDSDDNILEQQISTQTQDLVDAGDYDLEVQAGDQNAGPNNGPGINGADDVATVTLNERSTESIVMHTGSAEAVGSVSDLADITDAISANEITQSSEVAAGDLAVHQVVMSGFEGALDARANEDVTTEFGNLVTSGPLNLTIEEADPGANQNAAELDLSFGDNVTVIADGADDTYFIVVNTDTVNFKTPRAGESLPEDDDTALETNFTVLQDDAGFDFTPDSEFDDDENSETFVTFDANEPEINVDEPFDVSQAEAQTITGDTNIAPGTELTLRVSSDDGVAPSFLKTASPVVQPDGTYSATLDFSEQNVGDEYTIEVNTNTLPDGPVSEDGTVVEAGATDTATPEPDTATPEPDTDTPEPDTATPEPDTATPEPDTATPEPETEEPTSTPTSTPGFGVVVALTALLAAALLAVRRD